MLGLKIRLLVFARCDGLAENVLHQLFIRADCPDAFGDEVFDDLRGKLLRLALVRRATLTRHVADVVAVEAPVSTGEAVAHRAIAGAATQDASEKRAVLVPLNRTPAR